jgi:ERCC4-type nuclease
MIVLQDTRESRPWRFPSHVQVKKKTLKTGDYTVEGYEESLCIERKSLNDITSCLCKNELMRFTSQVKRMRQFKYRVIIVEADMADILNGKYRAPLPPMKALSGMLDVCLRFKVLLLFGGDAKSSAVLALEFFKSAIKQVDRGFSPSLLSRS